MKDAKYGDQWWKDLLLNVNNFIPESLPSPNHEKFIMLFFLYKDTLGKICVNK
jgi:hypothetical protein